MTVSSYYVLNIRASGLRLGQGAPPAVLPPDLTAQWLGKINSYMAEVQVIQDWVKAHPAQAASVGLDKDAANLPPSGDIMSYPKLAAIVGYLNASMPIDTTELQCILNLGAAVQAADAKIAAFPWSFVDFIQSPLGIGVGAGIVALGVGLVVL